jgi:hypothetical protein
LKDGESLIAFYLMKTKTLETLGQKEALELIENLHNPNHPLVIQFYDWLAKPSLTTTPQHAFGASTAPFSHFPTLRELIDKHSKKGRTIPLQQFLPLELALLKNL